MRFPSNCVTSIFEVENDLFVLFCRHFRGNRHAVLLPDGVAAVPRGLRDVDVVVAGLAEDALLGVLAQHCQGQWNVLGVQVDLLEEIRDFS